MNNEHTPFDSYRAQLHKGDKIQTASGRANRHEWNDQIRIARYGYFALSAVFAFLAWYFWDYSHGMTQIFVMCSGFCAGAAPAYY